MSVRKAPKGKKRAVEETCSEDEHVSEASSSTSIGAPRSARAREKQPAMPPVKKPKRAETRKCPVCDEAIPLRLLGKHAILESERLDEIMRCIGSTEVHGEAEPDDGLTARTRRSALKAPQHMKPGSSSTAEVTLEDTMKTLRTLKRHRKQRHAKLRELTREDEDAPWWGGRSRAEAMEGDGMVCPVCSKFVRGDVDVVEAHVDSCLAYERLRHEEEEAARGRNGRGSADIDLDGDADVDVEGGVTFGVMEGVSLRGTGFDIRNRQDQDVDDDIDVDGEDEVLYGAPQFTEHDVFAPPELAEVDGALSDADTEADVDVNDEAGASGGTSGGDVQREPKKGKTLHDLVAEGKVVRKHVEDAKRTMDEVMGVGDTEKVDLAVELARRAGDQAALVRALESKVQLLESTKVSSSTSSLCRICLDPYTEPTVSTGCWHTCCRECWLRCLGSTKLCPICKRITGATDLRRVYL
ncbi:hypothetical protein OH76DRAFT_1453623 [Lentinus brumalis]|uniref:RING-type domain-containing protein n=1 Tax=Lentinus brumalis TaxID=2498619 RepID=A0A371DMU7_9APHY|nr:hypothetical protein OH76DRAFT_1453623 [Polyporus brumalis]